MAAVQRESKITNVPPTFTTLKVKDGSNWLKTKRIDDDVEDGLWRLHDSIYDLTEFIDKHPGGTDWLEMTKGHDITEAVEAHHVFQERLIPHLERYKVRDTTRPRNSKLTFKADGFYVTLRKRVAKKLSTLEHSKLKALSQFYIDGLFATTLLLAVLSLRCQSYWLATVCALIYTWTGIAGHNFLHQRDNYRMYYFNLLFINYREWRITHALSHHLFPNSYLDFELLQFEPILDWTPTSKTWSQRYISWLISPFIYVGLLHIECVKKIVKSFCEKNYFNIDDAFPLIVPVIMYLLGGGATLFAALKWFLIIATIASFIFGLIGFNAGHHHPEVLHEGDAVRNDFDWGLYTIDTIIDRKESRHNTILAITHFGDHVLHHLFPTLDHAVLPHLYDTLFETLKEFEAEARAYPFWQLITGQFQQLARVEPMEICSLKRIQSKEGNVATKSN